MKIYIATEGEYSDYHISAVFTDKEQCMIYCATHGCDLEEYEADEAKLDTTKEVKEQWHAKFGYGEHFMWIENEGYCFDKPMSVSAYPYNACIFLTVALPLGTDEEKAKKICIDKFAQWKAEKLEKGENIWTAHR